MTCETSQFRIVRQAESDDVTRLIQMTKHKKLFPKEEPLAYLAAL